MAQLEQEKFDIQKQHTGNIQALLNDTNTRLQKMEDEYCVQAQNTVRIILMYNLLCTLGYELSIRLNSFFRLLMSSNEL